MFFGDRSIAGSVDSEKLRRFFFRNNTTEIKMLN